MTRSVIWMVVGAAFIVIVLVQDTSAQTTEFTYQGSLQNSSAPANGNFDFEFLLFDSLSAGTQIGSTLTRTNVAVANGIFAVKLDFGGQFPGAARFLEIHVRPAGGGAFTPLTPRQAVSTTPYSVKSLSSNSAATAGYATTAGSAQSLSGPLTGNDSTAIVSASNSASGISPNSGTPPAGLIGNATATSGQTVGVIGNSISTNGIGVLGNTDGTGGGGAPSTGVFGIASSTTGPANGVMGETSSANGWGVYGNARSTTGPANGVVGDTNSPNGSALVGRSFGTGDILQLISTVSGGNPKLRVLASGDFLSLGNINATNGFRTASGALSAGGTSATPNFSVLASGDLSTIGLLRGGSISAGGTQAAPNFNVASTGEIFSAGTLRVGGTVASPNFSVSPAGNITSNGSFTVNSFSVASALSAPSFALTNSSLFNVNTQGLITSSGGILTTGGSIMAQSGDITANTGLISASGNISSNNGNINAIGGEVLAKTFRASTGFFSVDALGKATANKFESVSFGTPSNSFYVVQDGSISSAGTISSAGAINTASSVKGDNFATNNGTLTIANSGNLTTTGQITTGGLDSSGDINANVSPGGHIYSAWDINAAHIIHAFGDLKTNGDLYFQTPGATLYGHNSFFDNIAVSGSVSIAGNLNVSGAKNNVVKLDDGRSVLLYALESPDNWFEDFGTVKLENGSAVVKIDPTFAQTTNVTIPYKVFLTPNGESRGLYVTNKTADSFEVREIGGGRSNIEFDFRIVARRKGYEEGRFAPAPQIIPLKIK